MLLILIILAAITTAAVILALRGTPKTLDRALDPAAEHYRPLFEPSKTELDALVVAETREAEVQQRAREQAASDERIAEFDKKVDVWSADVTREGTLEII